MKNLNFYSLDASNNQIIRMMVNELGNVGIGTNVASKTLEVAGDISFNGNIRMELYFLVGVAVQKIS